MMGGLNQPWHQLFLAFSLQFQDGKYEPDTNISTITNTSSSTSIRFQDGKYPFPTQTFMASDVDHPR